MSFAERLKKLRLQTGKSQKDFAEYAGIPQLVMNRLEKGNRQPDVETMVAIRKNYGANLNELFTGEENVSAGDGLPLFSDEDLCFAAEERIPRRWIVHPELADGEYAYRIKDSSMFPLISCADIVIVSYQAVETGDLVLCREKTRKVMVRRLECSRETTKFLVAENQDYPKLNLDNVQVLGRIIASVRVDFFKR